MIILCMGIFSQPILYKYLQESWYCDSSLWLWLLLTFTTSTKFPASTCMASAHVVFKLHMWALGNCTFEDHLKDRASACSIVYVLLKTSRYYALTPCAHVRSTWTWYCVGALKVSHVWPLSPSSSAFLNVATLSLSLSLSQTPWIGSVKNTLLNPRTMSTLIHLKVSSTRRNLRDMYICVLFYKWAAAAHWKQR